MLEKWHDCLSAFWVLWLEWSFSLYSQLVALGNIGHVRCVWEQTIQ